MTDPVGDVPALPPELTDDQKPDYIKIQYQAEVDAWSAKLKQQLSDTATATALAATVAATALALNETRADTARVNETTLLKGVHDAYITVSSAALTSAMTRLNVVTAAIASVTTIYTGLLALVYTNDATKGKTLTAAAIIPALFLGLALFLVSVYAAFFRKTLGVSPLLPSGNGGQILEYRIVTFMRWCYGGVLERAWALHAGIVSMGVGVMTLPVPFVKLTGGEQVAILIGGIFLVLLAGTVQQGANRRGGTRRRSHVKGQIPDVPLGGPPAPGSPSKAMQGPSSG